MKILLQYGESKKIKDINDVTELNDIIQITFNLSPCSYFVQKFNTDFQDFIDMVEGEDIVDKDKFKIVPLKQPQAAVVETYSDCSLTLSTIDNFRQPPVTCELTNIEEIPNVVIQQSHSKQWPAVITLPIQNFSKYLVDDLNAERLLSWDTSRELVGHLANYAYSFKPYPSKSERLSICNALVSEYPYLRNSIGSGVGGWEIKLLNKIKKLRQGDNSLEVKLNRLKSKVAGSNVLNHPNINPKRGELNWAPDHLPGETANSVNLHKKFLTDESLKSEKNQDKKKISTLMELTYSFRRVQINENISVSELKNEYPLFFQEKEQFEEFLRLTSVCVKTSFFERAASECPKLYQLFVKKKKSAEELLFFNQFEGEFTDIDESQKMKVQTSAGLFVLPHLLKDNIDCIFKTYSEEEETQEFLDFNSSHPHLLIFGNILNGSYIIASEGINLCITNNFVTAVALLISFYYTLNIKYPPSAVNTFKFLQNHLLNISGGSLPQKVQTLINRVNIVKRK